MKKNLRKMLILSAMAVSIGSFAFGLNYVNVKAENFSPSIKMVPGASVRIANSGDSIADCGNGIRFAMYMSKSDYQTLMAVDSGYTDVQFGVLIAPNTSDYTLTETSVFGGGEDKKYAWAEWVDIDSDGIYAWEYDDEANANYKRIMNFSSTEMYAPQYSWEDATNVYFRGSAIDLKEENIPYEFQGIGYIKYTYNGSTEYELTTAEIRSMTYVAQRAIEEGDSNEAWLQEKYVTPYMQGGKKETSTKYSVEHYFEQADGTYVIDESLTEKITSFIGSTVSSDEKEVPYYVFNDKNEENKIEGVVYANDKLVLKRYYNLAAEDAVNLGLKDTSNGETTISIADVPQGLIKNLYKLSGFTKLNVTKDLTGESISLNGLDGVYLFEATKEDGTVIVSRQFDVYDSTEAPVWTDYSLEFGHAVYCNSSTSGGAWKDDAYDSFTIVNGTDEGTTGTANYYKLNVMVEKGEYAQHMAIRAIPLHSKAYYQHYADLGYTLSGSVKMDVYTTPEDGSDPVALSSIDSSMFFNEDKWITNAGWKTYSTTLTSIINLWKDENTVEAAIPAIYKTSTLYKDSEYLAKSITLYAGNITLEPNLTGYTTETATSTALVDVAQEQAKAYDLTSLLTTSANKNALLNYAPYVNWTFTMVADGTIVRSVSATNTADLTTFGRGIYTVTASIGATVLFNGTVDFYSSKIFELYDFTLLGQSVTLDLTNKYQTAKTNGVYVWSSSNLQNTATSMVLSSVTSVGGGETGITEKIGSFVKVDFTAKADATSNTALSFGLALMHSKAYYQLYSDKSFRVDFICDGNIWGNANRGVINTNNYAKNTWTNGTATVQSLLDDWDNASIGKFALIDTNWGGIKTSTFYIGNFSLVD